MENRNIKNAMKKSGKILYWIPRILCILAILFISMFALDSFGSGISVWRQLAGFLVHLIPSFVLTAMLIVAWKYELTGGILFLLVSLGLSPFIFNHNFQRTQSVAVGLQSMVIVAFPFVLVGILFLISYFQRKRNLRAIQNQP
jgi:hypothetical protein